MRENIADGTFSAAHYHKMWSERLDGGKQHASGATPDEPYRVGRLLGEGAFGVVFSATTPEGKRAVMKSPIAASHNFEAPARDLGRPGMCPGVCERFFWVTGDPRGSRASSDGTMPA